MKKDIVLINWTSPNVDITLQREHLGLAYLSAYLSREGYHVDFIDVAFSDMMEEELAETGL